MVRRSPENEDAIIIGGDLQNVRIQSTIRDYACGQPKIYQRFSTEESLADRGIDVSVGLKTDFQASRGGASFLACSKRSTMS
jgi:hypothetical protein